MKLFISVISIFISTAAMAAKSPTSPDYSMAAVEVGFRSGTATVTGSDTDKQDSGYQLGASGVYNITEGFGIKSGLFYTTRPISSDILGTHFKGSITYFDVPLTNFYKFIKLLF